VCGDYNPPRVPRRRIATTLRGLIKSLAIGALGTLRQNKLATVLAAIACTVFTSLAITIQYDERPRYRETILPQIRRAEADFNRSLEAAERASTENWRLQYFITAHGKAKEILRIAAEQQPTSPDAIHAHNELIRYYQLVNENMAIIRTEMSIHQELDFLAEWKKQQLFLQHIRHAWLDWVGIE
jgi:hypothetical protein